MRGGSIVEATAGHGLLSALLLLLDDSSPDAIIIDIRKPPSHDKLMRALERQWPRLEGRIRFVESSLDEARIRAGDLVVAIHACGRLTDDVLDLALGAQSRVAVLPCCHDLKRCDSGGISGWVPGPLAVDLQRAQRLRQGGYRIQTLQIPEEITPHNRLLLGWPP